MSQDIDTQQDGPAFQYGGGQTKQGDIKSVRCEVISTGMDDVNVTEPSTPTHPQYPNNRVEQSLSGHVREIDDTPGAERIFEMHKSGTFYEVHPDGTKVTRIFGKDFNIVLDDSILVVGGNRHVVVQGDATLLIAGDCTQKIGGNLETIVHGDYTTRVSGKTTHYSKGDFQIETANNIKMLSTLKMQFQAKSDITLQTDTNLNTKASGVSKFWSTGATFVNGSTVHWNEPGSTSPTAIKILTGDIGPGLEVAESVVQPSIESQFVVRTDNNDIMDGVTDTKYPKDRKPFIDT